MAWKPHHDKIMPFWINNIYRSSADIQQIHTKLHRNSHHSHTQRQLEIDSYANAYFSTHFISCISSISMAFSAICNRYIHYNILRSIVTSFYTLFFLLRSTISFLIFFFLKYLDNTFFFCIFIYVFIPFLIYSKDIYFILIWPIWKLCIDFPLVREVPQFCTEFRWGSNT